MKISTPRIHTRNLIVWPLGIKIIIQQTGKEEIMGYLSELESFFNSIQNNSARSLSKEKLVKNFLAFMAQEYGHDEGYYCKKFDSKSTDYKNFNEYIYKHYMGLERDLRVEYEKIEMEAKGRIELYRKRVNDLNSKVEFTSTNKYTVGKYKFFLNINEELLRKANNSREKANVFRAALNNCRKSFGVRGLWTYADTFSDILQYVDIDWKSYINFLEASVEQSGVLAKKKNSDHYQYLILFKNYIDEHNILERLLCIASSNYYLHNRREIIEAAVNLFINENYVPFVYLLVPQIEGLFDVYKSLLGINNNEILNGLVDKLDAITKKQRLWGYVYYAFEFPVLRNHIAHGNMVDITPEIAYDTLMDIFYLFHEIESNDREYKIILDFLETFSCKQTDKDTTFVLEYFCDSLQSDRNLGWLKKCFDGDYDSMIERYQI